MLSLCSLEWFLLFVSYSLVTAILLTLVILSIKLSLFKLLRLRPDCYGPFEPVLQAQGGRPSVTHRIMCGVCAVLLSTYPDRSPWLSRLLWTLLSTSQHPLFFPKVLSFLQFQGSQRRWILLGLKCMLFPHSRNSLTHQHSHLSVLLSASISEKPP